MTINPKLYTSDLWQGVTDPKAKKALMDIAQKLEKLARDAESRAAAIDQAIDGFETVPVGTIVFWLGTVATIPTGWSEVTSLRSRFPRGMASGGTAGATGGSDKHTHGNGGGTGSTAGLTNSSGTTSSGHNMRDGTGASITLSDYPHNHYIAETTTLPPYVDGLWIRKD